MPSLICPGATYRPQPGGVGLDTALPPRSVWHITWDALRADGTQPDFNAVGAYLERMQYCPNIMWNPFTGEIIQYYPANVGGRALKYNNQDGRVCIQVEVFFSPGCVVNGRKYNTVADTPLKGFETLISWMETWGVPRRWPLGSPQWQGNSRDVDTWNGNAGHYGHCNSPGDTHTDPGPMPSLGSAISTQGDIVKPVIEEVEKMLIIAVDTSVDPNKVWIGDGITRRHVPNPKALEDLKKVAEWGMLKIFANGKVQTLPLHVLGVDVEELGGPVPGPTA